jgi:nucleotide-binding universal stress UspA family protein
MSGGAAQLVAGCCEELQAEGRRIVDEAVERATRHVVASSCIVEGTPVEEIKRLAAEIQPRFIVMGTHGRSGLNRLVMGSVAEGVVRTAPVPVMVVPPERHS